MGLTTDFIVGFPGETEADFEATLSLVREVQFDQAYTFAYSERRDTPATAMPDQVPQQLRDERLKRLLTVVNEVGASALRKPRRAATRNPGRGPEQAQSRAFDGQDPL